MPPDPSFVYCSGMKINVPLQAPIEILTVGDLDKSAQNGERIYLLLHGYSERPKNALKRWEKAFGPHQTLLIPHGPYPQPEKRETYWRVGYAWYFYDSFKAQYFITPHVPAQMLAHLLSVLVPKSPITVVGFSQGAYLAPYLPHYVENCDHVIMMNGLVRSDLVQAKESVRYDVLNATKDLAVDFNKSKDHFDKFQTNHSNCHFYPIDTDSHEIVESHIKILQGLIS